MPKSSTASIAFTIATLSGVFFVGQGTLASEPMRLNAGQMDTVTAGAAIQQSNATAVSVTKGGGSLAEVSTAAVVVVTDDKNAQASGKADATAASDLYAGTDADGLSLIAADEKTYAGVYTATSGAAVGDSAYSNSQVKTTTVQRGNLIIAEGSGSSYANGERVQVKGGTVPLAGGTNTIKRSTTTERTTKSGGLLTVTSGFALSANP